MARPSVVMTIVTHGVGFGIEEIAYIRQGKILRFSSNTSPPGIAFNSPPCQQGDADVELRMLMYGYGSAYQL